MTRHPDTALSAYVTGSLGERERVQVEQHLAGCDACRAAVEDFRAIVESLAANAPEPPPVAWPRYRAELRARREAARRPTWRERLLRPLPIGAAAAVATASVALMLYLVPGTKPAVDLALIEYDGLAGLGEQIDLLEDLDVIRHLDRLAPTKTFDGARAVKVTEG